ncbi:short-chain dehydrogenase [Paractinoplanes abujensis]|uniref:NAD(P)-dependent dehydrogenase (Short-subunit alcohol dehydrogenase family) n=1 Tax=Paractinoplanes abujensis TaxID=882441 RepID=A0A7W7G3Q1_9ACTN|nr:SDR family NAD(P)-dependent oxidoreductase [Actinoplanes abujensis]MBB4692996.1 NAD(P)-dependent dehydrogenase (short-subunit alcohol dehydrogenase family) [Actinoplanes abujensis]GID22500.1 short-chain dehydrogenase [Actinoplanes abujensis]
MARIVVTGAADGLGRLTAATLLGAGHDVIVHARNAERLTAVRDLLDRGAAGVTGDLADLGQTRDLAEQVNRLGRADAVIHNAGVLDGAHVMPVNVLAPYVLTALIARPRRLVYLTSGMHSGGRPDPARLTRGGSYSDSKLFVTALALAVARRRPDVISNAVDPGWVPTRMGGRGAPDDLRLGHLTQEWLTTSGDPEADTTGGYWFHQRRHDPHPAAGDPGFQEKLLAALYELTGVALEEESHE